MKKWEGRERMKRFGRTEQLTMVLSFMFESTILTCVVLCVVVDITPVHEYRTQGRCYQEWISIQDKQKIKRKQRKMGRSSEGKTKKKDKVKKEEKAPKYYLWFSFSLSLSLPFFIVAFSEKKPKKIASPFFLLENKIKV